MAKAGVARLVVGAMTRAGVCCPRRATEVTPAFSMVLPETAVTATGTDWMFSSRRRATTTTSSSAVTGLAALSAAGVDAADCAWAATPVMIAVAAVVTSRSARRKLVIVLPLPPDRGPCRFLGMTLIRLPLPTV
jgi:hypothetical protein